MKSLNDWFAEYSVSHQNETNKKIHYICVPVIYFSIIGLLLCLPPGFLEKLFPYKHGFIINWAFVSILLVIMYYSFLSVIMAFRMLVFSMACLFVNYFIGTLVPLLPVVVTLFVLAWIGQFYGHKLEGKKPSFLKDIQFLLIGPAWVLNSIFNNNKNV